MSCNFIRASLLAAGMFGLTTAAMAYEGPQERALDQSLQQAETQNYNAPAAPAPSSNQTVSPDRTAAMGGTADDPSQAPPRPHQTGPGSEGPEEQALDRSLMEYNVRQGGNGGQ